MSVVWIIIVIMIMYAFSKFFSPFHEVMPAKRVNVNV